METKTFLHERFGFGARHWHTVPALWTLIVKVAGSILGLRPRCVCVFSVTALPLEGSAATTTPDVKHSGTEAQNLMGEECSRQG